MYAIKVGAQFDAGHRLFSTVSNHKCNMIHGHTYTVIVNIKVRTDSTEMIIDFADFKKILRQQIIEQFDHSLILNLDDPILDEIPQLSKYAKIVTIQHDPTAESLSRIFLEKIENELMKITKYKIISLDVEVFETPNNSASYSKQFEDDESKDN